MYDKIKRTDISDITNDNTTVVIDVDGIIFRVAAVAEQRTIKAINKSTMEVELLKTRTELYGRSKTKIGSGSWLANRNIEREVAGLEPYTKEDWDVEDVVTTTISLDRAKSYVTSYIDSIVKHCGCIKKLLLIGGDTNFRDDLKLPSKYKGNRDDTLKPTYLKELRDWMLPQDDVEVSDGIEADDVLSIYMTKGYRDYIKTGVFSYIGGTNDKDSRHTSGLLFDWTKENNEFIRPYFLLIPDSSKDIGEVYLNKNGVKFYGLKGLAYQLCVSDDSDNYSCYKFFDFKRGTYGNTQFYKDFATLETAQEILEQIKTHYKTLFPNGVKYTSWCGEEMDLSWQEWLELQFKCAYMRRNYNDTMTAEKLFKNFGVDFE